MTDETRLQLQRRIGHTLKLMGIYPNVKGYKYIIDLVLLGVERDIMPITHNGYKAIAEKYSITNSSIDRAIRHAVDKAYSRTPADEWIEMMGNDIRHHHLTNSEFLSILIEKFTYEIPD